MSLNRFWEDEIDSASFELTKEHLTPEKSNSEHSEKLDHLESKIHYESGWFPHANRRKKEGKANQKESKECNEREYFIANKFAKTIDGDWKHDVS